MWKNVLKYFWFWKKKSLILKEKKNVANLNRHLNTIDGILIFLASLPIVNSPHVYMGV